MPIDAGELKRDGYVFVRGIRETQLIKIAEELGPLRFDPRNQNACKCPACSGQGIITGQRFKELPEQYADGELYNEVEYLGTSFQCKACDLSLNTIEEIAHAGLSTHFKKTESTSLHDLYEPEHYQEYDNM
jgi:hypothetical protein